MKNKQQTLLDSSNRNINDGIDNVYNMLTRQQQTIANLLNKYKKQQTIDVDFNQKLIKQRSQTIDTSSLPSNHNMKKMYYNRTKASSVLSQRQQAYNPIYKKSQKIQKSYQDHDYSLALPIVHKKKVRLLKSARGTKEKSDLSIRLQKSREKVRLREDLYKIYGQDDIIKSKVSFISKKSNPRKKKQLKPLSHNSRLQSISTPHTPSIVNTNHDQQKKIDILQPLQQNSEKQIESSDQSQAQEIAPTYYQRQFRQTMRSQCMEEINFLYFSKNQAMKDWTQRLLSLFERHDKQITAARYKAKYLQSFDEKFWNVGIYNTDDF